MIIAALNTINKSAMALGDALIATAPVRIQIQARVAMTRQQADLKPTATSIKNTLATAIADTIAAYETLQVRGLFYCSFC